jgi:hypothetical protein
MPVVLVSFSHFHASTDFLIYFSGFAPVKFSFEVVVGSISASAVNTYIFPLETTENSSTGRLSRKAG